MKSYKLQKSWLGFCEKLNAIDNFIGKRWKANKACKYLRIKKFILVDLGPQSQWPLKKIRDSRRLNVVVVPSSLSIFVKRQNVKDPIKNIYINNQHNMLSRFSNVRISVRLSVYMRTSPAVYKISILSFAPGIFSIKRSSVVGVADVGLL